ncbi:MAG TPA: trehalase family glycosidase [Acidobacteriota bacterium]|nr:trehalase family glycosidase [Acidobacteriota bacterium]
MVSWSLLVTAGLLCIAPFAGVFAPGRVVRQQKREPILEYIKHTWTLLTRSNRTLAAEAVDPKFRPMPDGRWPVYVPRNANLDEIEAELRGHIPGRDFERIRLLRMPSGSAQVPHQGLLYLPRPYVVPGGRFNEMYGWDSYFIQIGLLRDNLVPFARDLADNFLYEVRNYDRILNANRTYYLTRSQPPFLTQMLLGVYRKTHDRDWLRASLPEIEKYYQYWTTEPHLTPHTGLSRYYDLGEGPAPEVLAAELDSRGRTHYDLVKEYFRTHKVIDYDVSQYYDAKHGQLTPLFYKGDRSMRESGFDPSDRYGPFSADIIHYNPVCLNSLLYLMEKQTAEILRILDRSTDAAPWLKRAEERADRINRLMWDERDGLYYDYDFVHSRIRRYPFLTTFYPLWAGIAPREKADRVVTNLQRFEESGGLQTSTNRSGNQWDAPFGWAPLELIAVEGLRQYGYAADANRITEEFLSLVAEQYRVTGRIVEKYDVAGRSANVSSELHFGYHSNEVGFGWTNAVFTVLLDELPAEQKRILIARLGGSDPNPGGQVPRNVQAGAFGGPPDSSGSATHQPRGCRLLYFPGM